MTTVARKTAELALQIHSTLEWWLSGKNWYGRVIAVALLIPIAFFPTHTLLHRLALELKLAFTTNYYFWDSIEVQAYSLLQPIPCPNEYPDCHEEKMLFRLFLPILYRLVHSRLTIYFIQLACWPIFVYLLAKEAYRLTKDRVIALYLVVCIMGVYAGAAFPFDFVICGDAFAYFFLLVAASSRNRWLLFGSLFVAYWVDERAFINSIYVGVYHIIANGRHHSFFDQTNRSVILVIIGSWALYLLLRFGLGALYNVQTPNGSANPEFMFKIPFALHVVKTLRSFEVLWLLIALGFLRMLQQRNFILLTILIGCLSLTTIVSLMVADTSRSMNYAFLLFMIVLPYAKALLTENRLRTILFILALICVFVPTRFLLNYQPDFFV